MARSLDPSIIDLQTNHTRKRVTIHGVLATRYRARAPPERKIFARRSRRKTRAKIPSAVRWLGQSSEVKARSKEASIVASSVAFVAVGEAVFGRLCESGLRLLDRRYAVKVFEDIPGAQCGRCSGCGHIQAHCTRDALCALCAEEHRIDKHKCPVVGCAFTCSRGLWILHVAFGRAFLHILDDGLLAP